MLRVETADQIGDDRACYYLWGFVMGAFLEKAGLNICLFAGWQLFRFAVECLPYVDRGIFPSDWLSGHSCFSRKSNTRYLSVMRIEKFRTVIV